jgi:lysophospholipase L1-like esterase
METLNRRDCLKTVALAGAGALILPCATACADTSGRPFVPAYPTPAFKKGSTILFQGDSITHGGRGADLNHYMGHGYPYLIAARLGADRYDQDLKFLNRGISGNRVTDLQARWQVDTLDLKPDVLSILVGVNDMGRGVDAPAYQEQYTRLLQETRDALPGTKLILCEPFSFASDKRKAFQEVVQGLASTFRAIHVPLQHVFDTAAALNTPAYWLWDGTHPTPAGHELLARAWLQTVTDQYSRSR